MPTPACPTRDELTQYLAGRLPADRSENIDMHLQECTACEETMTAYAEKSDTLLVDLHRSRRPGEFLDEPQCQQALAGLAAIGREPSFATQQQLAHPADGEADLGEVGPYRLLAKLGAGGMGTVYKAFHTKLKRVVALKVLPSDRMQDEQAVARFEREMEAVGQLVHPNIVMAHDAGEFDGTHFLVMEYVEGLDLSELVRRRGPLPIGEACELVRQAAVGLQYAHEHGLVHRDIKPSNLMLASRVHEKHQSPATKVDDGVLHTPYEPPTLKILDLGLALLAGAQDQSPRDLTLSGQTMGTLDYMAPEQGGDSHDVDARADIYALGATLYKLLTGEAIYSGEKYATAMQKLTALALAPAPRIQDRRSDIPDEVAAIVHKMIAKDREDRYSTASEVAQALAPFADALSVATGGSPGATTPDTGDPPVSTTSTTSLRQEAQTQETQSQLPLPVGEGWGEGNRRYLIPAAVALSILAIVTFAAIYTFRTPQGTVEIQLAEGIDAESIEVAVKQNGKVIQVADAKQGWTIKLENGKYDLDLQGGSDKFQLENNVVNVKRGDKQIVRIALKSVPGSDDAETSLPRRPKAALEKSPLGRMTLVQYPSKLPGLASWTVDTLGHRGRILDAAFSPDGKWIATTGADGTVRIWESVTGRQVHVLLGHDSEVMSLSWAPDSMRIVTAGDTAARVWDTAAGKLLVRLEGHQRLVTAADWSVDGKLIATSSFDGTIRLFDATSGESVRTIPIFKKGVGYNNIAIAISPDNGRLAASAGNRIQIWNLSEDKFTSEWELKSGKCNGIVWSADGKRVAAWDTNIYQIFDVDSGTTVAEFDAGGGSASTNLFWRDFLRDLSPDADIALYQTTAKPFTMAVRWWDVARSRRSTIGRVVAVSPKGEKMILAGVGAHGSALPEADLPAPPETIELRRHSNSSDNSARLSIAWAPQSEKLALAIGHGNYLPFQIWDTSTGRIERVLDRKYGGTKYVDWSAQGNRLVAGHENEIRAWDTKTWETLETPNFQKPGVKLSPDGSRICTGGYNLHIWEFGNDEPVLTLVEELHGGGSGAFPAWSPTEDIVAATWLHSGNEIKRFDATTGKELPTISGADDAGLVSFSANGRWIGSARRFTHDRLEPLHVVVNDAKTGERVNVFPGHEAAVLAIAWLNDDQQIATAGDDAFLRVWDRESHTMVAEHAIPAGPVEFSRDGQLFSVSTDQEVRLYQTVSGQALSSILVLDKDKQVVVSADGHFRSSEPLAAGEIRYVALTEDGRQLTLTPAEFERQYGWKNDPARVRLVGDGE